jgi:3-oxoacyl-[acyl-carrier-protein] synthase-3
VSLIALAGVVGTERLSLAELGARFDLPPERIQEKTGVTGLQRFGESESLVQVASELIAEVLERASVAHSAVRSVFGSSNPTADDLIPTFTAAAASAAGLTDLSVDQVGIGCCGALQALRSAYNQLTVEALDGVSKSYALVVVGDQTSRILDKQRRQTGTLFGEGASVALLTNDPDARTGYEVVRVATRSRLGDSLYSLRLRNPYAEREPGPLPRLEMEGRRVFEFGAHAMREFLSMLGLARLPDDCFVVPHQPNLRMLEALADDSGLPADRIYMEGIRTIGNTSGPAALLGLEDALRSGAARATDGVLLGAFGAEMQAGAALLAPRDPLALVAHPPWRASSPRTGEAPKVA